MSALTDLKAAISKWLDSRKSANLSLLAKHCGVSYPTVRRIASGEGEPSLEVALAIAGIVMPAEEQEQFLAKHYPAFSKYLQQVVPGNKDYPTELHEFLTSKEHALIIAMVTSENGATLDEVQDQLGFEGIRAVKNLIDSGWLIEGDNGALKAKDNVFSVKNPAVAMKQIALWAGIYDTENLKRPWVASYSFLTEKLNKSGVNALNQLDQEYMKKRLSIMRDEKFRGEITTYSAAFTNVISGGKTCDL